MDINVVSLVGNFILLTFLGLLVAFSPMLIVVNMIIVLTTKRPIWNALILIAGVVTPLILIALFAEQFIGPTTDISISAVKAKIQIPALIDVFLGLGLLGYGLKRAYQYKREDTKEKTLTPPTDRPKSLFVFGFMKSLLSVTNVFAILVVVQVTKKYSNLPVLSILGFLWTILIGLIPFIAIIYYSQYKPMSLERINKKINDLLKTNVQLFLVIILFMASAYFLVNGVSKLVTKS